MEAVSLAGALDVSEFLYTCFHRTDDLCMGRNASEGCEVLDLADDDLRDGQKCTRRRSLYLLSNIFL